MSYLDTNVAGPQALRRVVSVSNVARVYDGQLRVHTSQPSCCKLWLDLWRWPVHLGVHVETLAATDMESGSPRPGSGNGFRIL